MAGEENILRSFGEELRQAREAQRRSIDEIATRTRINHRYIEAIEQGDLASLPSGPYTRAFLREYARAVGCTVPPELANLTNAGQADSSVTIRPQVSRVPNSGSTDRPQRPVTSSPTRTTPPPKPAGT